MNMPPNILLSLEPVNYSLEPLIEYHQRDSVLIRFREEAPTMLKGYPPNLLKIAPNDYLNMIIPINIITMMARITAPSRPKINQPIRNAIIEPNPIALQFTSTVNYPTSLSYINPGPISGIPSEALGQQEILIP
ncbi:MAG: hypothetical protein LUO93_04330 [Methanomicrobiales archaeon]|nr:hypothetical protein [Methanomicrobiales archaeon]